MVKLTPNMIYFNILSAGLIFIVFCSLFVVVPSNKIDTCYSEMEKYFGNIDSPMIDCIRKAVIELTANDPAMHRDVSSYYNKFLYKVKEGSIFLPFLFCQQSVKGIHESLSAAQVMNIVNSCMEQLKKFLRADPEYHPTDANRRYRPTGGPYDVFQIALFKYKVEEESDEINLDIIHEEEETDEVNSDDDQEEEEESDEDTIECTQRNLYLIRVSQTIEEHEGACNQTPRQYCDEIHAGEKKNYP